MIEQSTDLKGLIARYEKRVSEIETELSSIKNKIAIAKQALALLESEGMGQDRLFNPTDAYMMTIERFRGVRLPDAIKSILLESNKPMTRNEILKEIKRNGFRSETSDLGRDVSVQLNRFKKQGKVNQTKEHGVYFYALSSIGGDSTSTE